MALSPDAPVWLYLLFLFVSFKEGGLYETWLRLLGRSKCLQREGDLISKLTGSGRVERGEAE